MEQRKNKLFEHIPHWHVPLNVNDIHRANQEISGFNRKLAVMITNATSSMWTAYLFTLLAIIGLFGLLGWLNPFTFLLTTWISQQFLQLVFLPILSVGQSELGKHQELMAEEAYDTTVHSFSDIEQIAKHLDQQDDVILEILRRLDERGETNGQANDTKPLPTV